MDRTVGAPPIADLLGMTLVEFEEGRAVIVAEGTVVHAGRRLATAEGRLTDEATGKLLAHATTGCVLIS